MFLSIDRTAYPAECLRTVAFAANAFDVQQDSSDISNVEMDGIATNIGDALDGDGSFSAPIGGVYFFQVSARANGNGAAPLLLFRGNDVVLSTGRSNEDSVGPYPTGTDAVLLRMDAGDSVQLKVKARKTGFFSSLFSSITSSSTDVSFVGYKLTGC
jgi:hypothetical protein